MYRRPVITLLSLTLAASALPALATGSAAAVAPAAVAAVAEPLAVTSTRLALRAPKAFGDKLVVTAKVNGAANPKVVFVVEANGTVKRVRATGNATGVATASFIAPYSGVVTAEYAGDAGHDASTSAPKAFTAPSRTTLTQRGYYKSVKGVRYYKAVSSVTFDGRVRPAGQRYATVKLEAKRNGVWTVLDSSSGYTDVDGSAPFRLVSANTNVTYRVRFSFGGDSFNRGSVAPTQYFRIG